MRSPLVGIIIMVLATANVASATDRITLVVRGCATAHREINSRNERIVVDDGNARCGLFRNRDSGPVEWCQEESFDVTVAEDSTPMTKERCQTGAMLQATMGLTAMGITVCGATCNVESDPAYDPHSADAN